MYTYKDFPYNSNQFPIPFIKTFHIFEINVRNPFMKIIPYKSNQFSNPSNTFDIIQIHSTHLYILEESGMYNPLPIGRVYLVLVVKSAPL